MQAEFKPLSLRQLCFQTISRAATLPYQNEGELSIVNVGLPRQLSLELFDHCIEETVSDGVNGVLKLFLKAPAKTPLPRICLRNSRQADVKLVRDLVKVNLNVLTHVDVRGCRTLPKTFWDLINLAPRLRSLKTTKLLIPIQNPSLAELTVDWEPRNLSQRVQQRIHPSYYDKILATVLPNLKRLDLSWCPWTKRLRVLRTAKKLEVLILRNCDVSNLVEDIGSLTEIRVLDISCGLERETTRDFGGVYPNPGYIMGYLVNSLVNLESLDISGTNLCRIKTTASGEEYLHPFQYRRGNPLTFLGLYDTPYSSQRIVDIPAKCISGRSDEKEMMEAIKRNCDSPQTLRCLLLELYRVCGNVYSNPTELLRLQIKMMESVRLNDYFRQWMVKCVHTFLDTLSNPSAEIGEDAQRELFLALNRLMCSHLDEKVPEALLATTFQIYLKLLPEGRRITHRSTCHQIMVFGKFLLSLKTTTFVYLKTEALVFRLLYRISQEPEICKYLSHHNGVKSCFDFFNTLQIFLGFSLSVGQTSEIVPVVWKTVLNFMKGGSDGSSDFLMNNGFSWMHAHLDWFTKHPYTSRELLAIFTDVINHVHESGRENEAIKNAFASNHAAQQVLAKLTNLRSNR